MLFQFLLIQKQFFQKELFSCLQKVVNVTNRGQKAQGVTECRQRSKVKTLWLQYCALHRLQVTDGQNTHDQITRGKRSRRLIKLRSVHSIHSQWKSKGMLAKYMRRMRNNNLEIRILGSSCRLQVYLILRFANFGRVTAQPQQCLKSITAGPSTVLPSMKDRPPHATLDCEAPYNFVLFTKSVWVPQHPITFMCARVVRRALWLPCSS